MIINPLDAHDRLQAFKKNDFEIGACCQSLIDQEPFGVQPFYIFAHVRTCDDGVTKKMIWQPRLTKPAAQTNSMLFKAYPGTDNIKVIWILPPEEMWPQYLHGKLCASVTIVESIREYKNNRAKLEAREDDDASDEKIAAIYTDIRDNARRAASVASSVS